MMMIFPLWLELLYLSMLYSFQLACNIWAYAHLILFQLIFLNQIVIFKKARKLKIFQLCIL